MSFPVIEVKYPVFFIFIIHFLIKNAIYKNQKKTYFLE